MTGWLLRGGEALLGGALRRADVALDGGVVAGPRPGLRAVDCAGLRVLPGLVDIHGDAHERCAEPRPGVAFPPGFALADAARQCLAAGITTAYLGLTLSWEPGLRSPEAFEAWLRALADAPRAPELRVHLRLEADNFDAFDAAEAAIGAGRVHLLGFNDHTPGILPKLGDPAQVVRFAHRSGLAPADYIALAGRAASRRPEVPAGRARMAAAARRAGIPALSHDEASVAERHAFRALGATICEFPLAEAVAQAAREVGEHVVMGAPNVVRGGSHLGWASAAPLAERGLVTVLASDYHWPALWQAPFRLARRGRLSLAEAWALVSANPAEALGLRDRGRLDAGLRGDAALAEGEALLAVFCAGDLAWSGPGFAQRLSAHAA